MDVMFVCGLPFLVTLSRNVCFITVQSVPCRTASELANGIRNVMNLYCRAGFVCQTAFIDGEFEKVKDKLLSDITVNIRSKNEHVPDIEQKIQHIKECCHYSKSDIPAAVLPNVIIKQLVLHSVMFLNAFPDKQGISKELSPREIILRWQLDFKCH
jgi:hypothetical protein